MKTYITATLCVIVFARLASSEELPVGRPPTGIVSERTPGQAAPVVLAPTGETWIPIGKFGLVLDDGDRVVGVPSKRWTATLKTRFGEVTIPRGQFSRIESVADEVHVHLNNGDRVSGTLLSETMVFETQYGPLIVPTEAIVRLSTRQALRIRKTASTIDSLIPRLKGHWLVTYTNKTQHPRQIHENLLVNEGDQLVQENGDLLILFPNVIERITLIDDKLFVEHFNPRSTYPDGIPVVMGVGARTSK